MPLVETVGNLHMHTTCSDGGGSHADLVEAATDAGLEWIIVTDHNVRPDVPEGWRDLPNGRSVLMLIGQEINDTTRQPQVNHLLCLGIQSDLSRYASDPQALIDAVNDQGGAAFLAHPIEYGTSVVPEELPWVDWHISGYAGIELWNVMSEVKSHATGMVRALLLAFFPQAFIRGPFEETLKLWNHLSSEKGEPVIMVGGSDAHASRYRFGPLHRSIYPYDFLFRTVNTHALIEGNFTGDTARDRSLLVDALRHGRSWIGYDGLASTQGSRFHVRQGERYIAMGGAIALRDDPLLLEFFVPHRADLLILKDGERVAATKGTSLTHRVTEPGIYRAEAWRRAWSRRRGWIFCNPLWVS